MNIKKASPEELAFFVCIQNRRLGRRSRLAFWRSFLDKQEILFGSF